MKPKWIICNNLYTDGNPEKMRTAAEKAGCEVNWFKYIPFEKDSNQKLSFEYKQAVDCRLDTSCVICYGSIQFCKLIERATKWIPGCWTPWDDLYCSSYMAYWGQYSVHENYTFLPLAEFRRNSHTIFGMYGRANKFEQGEYDIFIKPDNNEKTFHGEIVTTSNYDKWIAYCDIDSLSPETMCLISTPVDIKREWRTVVADKKFVTGSQYRKQVNGESSIEIEPGCPKEVVDWIENLLGCSKTVKTPCDLFCVDVCELSNGALKVVEIGGMNCAGLYDCDMDKVVEAANTVAFRDWDSIYRM